MNGINNFLLTSIGAHSTMIDQLLSRTWWDEWTLVELKKRDWEEREVLKELNVIMKSYTKPFL
jgi:hypothetical protein